MKIRDADPSMLRNLYTVQKMVIYISLTYQRINFKAIAFEF